MFRYKITPNFCPFWKSSESIKEKTGTLLTQFKIIVPIDYWCLMQDIELSYSEIFLYAYIKGMHSRVIEYASITISSYALIIELKIAYKLG